MKGFLLDTSFLFALYGDEGERTRIAESNFRSLFSRGGNILVVPWPILYEGFNTRFSGDWRRIRRVDSEWSRLEELHRLQFLDDSAYRDESLRAWRTERPRESKKRARGVSLVDRVLIAIMEDRNLEVRAILTFDLRDFRDVSERRNIEIFPGA